MWVRWKFSRGTTEREVLDYFTDAGRSEKEKLRALALALVGTIGLIGGTSLALLAVAGLIPDEAAKTWVLFGGFMVL